MNRLDGKVAVILGAAGTGNMGQVMARRFAAEGARIVVGGRHEEPLKSLAEELGGRYATCDITKKSDLENLAKTAVDAFGKVDVAVNCTGWGLLAKLLDTTEEQIDKLAALQFKGPYFFLQVFCDLMSKSGGGSIIQISSASVYAGLDNHAAYIGTKAAGDAVVKCFAREFGRKGIKINSIAPGLTSSPMTEGALSAPGLLEAFIREYPLGRVGTSDDVANAALWLASDESFITGEVLQINGGLVLRRNPTQPEINASMKAAASRS